MGNLRKSRRKNKRVAANEFQKFAGNLAESINWIVKQRFTERLKWAIYILAGKTF